MELLPLLVKTGKSSHSEEPKNTRTEVIKCALEALAEIKDIYDFDPKILTPSPLKTRKDVDESKPPHWVDFYDDKDHIRRNAYNRYIETPLLELLGIVGIACSKWNREANHVGVFHCLRSPEARAVDPEFIRVAITDIFGDQTHGLGALEDALKKLLAISRKELKSEDDHLSKKQLDSLKLFWKLAGFVYDQYAVTQLIKTCEFIPKNYLNNFQMKLAMLALLLDVGEQFKRLLPSTLTLDGASVSVLKALRNQLVRLSPAMLEKVSSTISDKIFEGVQKDINCLHAHLQEVGNRFQLMIKMLDGSPAENLWSHLKLQPETRQISSWDGFKALQKFLEHSPNKSSRNRKRECDKLLPIPTELLNVKYYNDRKKKILKVLKDLTTKTSPEHLQCALLNKLEAKSDTYEAVDKETADKVTKAKCAEYLDCLPDPLPKQATKEIEELRDNFVAVVIGSNPSDEMRIKLQDINAKRKKLTEELNAISPCCGYGNLSKRYQEFLTKLKNVLPEDTQFDGNFQWVSDVPLSAAEEIFHTVHKTGVSKQCDKRELIKIRIDDILRVIEYLRDIAGITTDLRPLKMNEVHKEAMHKQSKIMIDTLKPLENNEQEVPKELGDLPTHLYNCGKDLVKSVTTETANKLIDQAKRIPEDFLKKLKDHKLFSYAELSSLQQKMKETASNDDAFALEVNNRVAEVKKDYRNHYPQMVTEYLKKCFERHHSELSAAKDLVPEICKTIDTTELWKPFASLDEFLRQKIEQIHGTKSPINSEFLEKTLDYNESIQAAFTDQFPSTEILTTRIIDRFKLNVTAFLACKCLVLNIYGMLKDIDNHPSLTFLRPATSSVRNSLSHGDAIKMGPWVNELSMYDDDRGKLAKEIAILSINVKSILQDVAS